MSAHKQSTDPSRIHLLDFAGKAICGHIHPARAWDVSC
jgi:hypothetical protein